jgi:hypothetical protein
MRNYTCELQLGEKADFKWGTVLEVGTYRCQYTIPELLYVPQFHTGTSFI